MNDDGGDGGGVVFIVSLFCMEYLLKIVSICIFLSLVFDFPYGPLCESVYFLLL